MNSIVYLEGGYKVRWVEDATHAAGWWVTLASTGEVLRGPFHNPQDGVGAARRYERLAAVVPVNAADRMTAVNALTVADALVAYALQPDSTDERIRRVIAALREFGYTETADTMERLNEHSVKA